MTDNNNNQYEILEAHTRKITVEVNERGIMMSGFKSTTVQFDNDPLYTPGVTDLFITMEYLSEIDRAIFHVVPGQ
jgi:hypothetical protein